MFFEGVQRILLRAREFLLNRFHVSVSLSACRGKLTIKMVEEMDHHLAINIYSSMMFIRG
jgi:hypothetical protein